MVLGVKRRGHRRVKIKCPVLIRTTYGWLVGEALNISSTGVLVCCTKPLRVNEFFELVIDTLFSGPPLNATAQVVWSGIHGLDNEFVPHVMGMRFTKISKEDRNLISTFVAGYLEQKRTTKVIWPTNHESALEPITPPTGSIPKT
jgi:hypothetical protein